MNREEGRIIGERPERLMLCKWRARFETIERRAEKWEPAPYHQGVSGHRNGNGDVFSHLKLTFHQPVHAASRSEVALMTRAHDVPNLFICDGSVLPTSTAVNPSLKIEAIAARVADRICKTARWS
jgi:choline dehydrogenase-like flavoprotein